MKANEQKLNRLLQNFILNYDLSISSIEEGVKKLASQQKDLEAIHILIENIDYSCFNKKEYYNIAKVDRLSKLNEWIYLNSVNQEDYKKYLDKYLPLRKKLKYDDVDEYILQKHYRPQAVKILSAQNKKFSLAEWTKPRFRFHYKRKTNLLLKDGQSFRFDFRNWLESLFILKQGDDKIILAVGGSGGSGQRQHYTMFTAIFYLLAKKKPIKHHLINYNSFNRFEFVKTYTKPIVTFDLGSNYPLDRQLQREIEQSGKKMSISALKEFKF